MGQVRPKLGTRSWVEQDGETWQAGQYDSTEEIDEELERVLSSDAHEWGKHVRAHVLPEVFAAIRKRAGLSQRELARRMSAVTEAPSRMGSVGAITFRINQFEAGKQSLRDQDLSAAQRVLKQALYHTH